MTFQSTVCPHDCPSCCALEVEVLDRHRIGAVRGAADNTYTAGVICAKVARYAERQHHPDRLTTPLLRTGPKGSGEFRPIGWDEALDRVADQFKSIAAEHGKEAIWPYYFAGTMGLVQRDGIQRLRHVMGYSRQKNTICSMVCEGAWIAGSGRIVGPDPREMAESDLIVMWGGNPVATQVNVMTHISRARKRRGAKLIVVDPYRTGTAAAADMHLAPRPGTDGALACAVMHAAFRDGYADRDYMAKYADHPAEFEAHLATRTPEWASEITGLSVAEIEAFALAYNSTARAYVRLGYGFTRHRNGASMFHAVTCLPTVTGKWQHVGGGAFWSARGIYGINKSLIEGHDARDTSVRELDMSRIASVLTGNRADLGDGPPVHALFIQNTNPMVVAPDSNKVRRGFLRDDLFTVVHEQFMTETAMMADIVLPATTFLEHDDFYQGGGHTHLQVGRKLVEPVGECRSNHEVLQGLASRLGAKHPGFDMTALELVDATLRLSGYPGAEEVIAARWLDRAEDFRTSHYLDGFAHPDGKFRFAPDWSAIGANHAAMPRFPDHQAVFDHASDGMPYRLVTAPARQFLNTSFTETPTAKKREGRPTAMLHAADAARLGVGPGDRLRLGNDRGEVILHAAIVAGQQEGTIVVESVWPNAAFEGGIGINALTSDDAAYPNGGAVFHDTAIWARAEAMAGSVREDRLAAE